MTGRREAQSQQSGRTADIDVMFTALSTPEKRSALMELGGARRGQSTKSEAEVENAILECGRSEAEIASVLRRAETSAPKKHCLFGRVRGDTPGAVSRAIRFSRQGDSAAAITFACMDEAQRFASFTVERPVASYEWVRMPGSSGFDEVWGKRPVLVRHAIIVRVDIATSRATLTYKGLPIGIDYDYAVAVDATLRALSDAGLDIEALPVRGCITSLITAKGRRVLPVRGDVITPEGEIRLRSRTGKATIEQLVARLLESDEEVAEATLLNRITLNLGKHTFETIGLLWADEKILTRVAFWNAGADFLFVWGRTDPSFAVIERIATLLYGLAEALDTPDFNVIWSVLSASDHGAILLPGEFRNRFAAPSEVTDHVLLEAVRAGLLEPVFRIDASGDVLDELGQSEWTTNLPKLKKTFRTSEGFVIDGSDPRSIRVAFRRVRIGGRRVSS